MARSNHRHIDPDLSTILAGETSAFALLHRVSAHCDGIEILTGEVEVVDRLADLPLPPIQLDADRADVLTLVPYRQVAERGFSYHDDSTPLVAMKIRGEGQISLDEAIQQLPDDEVVLADGHFDVSDDAYAQTVRKVLEEEIGRGAGSNFVIRRSFVATIANHSTRTALSIFRRLLHLERGAYWTFIVHYGDRTLVGATPERHISLLDGVAVMNPISGTYRYPAAGPRVEGLLRFLGDRKEADELFMVVDEELKMMGQVCERGGRLIGPQLREMARLAHTEYLIEGHTNLDVCDILRATMFAPTVTGSPLGSACRVILKYEEHGRGYYGGILALVGQRGGARTLDSSILIRTADISHDGRVEIGVGATLVRQSDPENEVAETKAKIAALLAAIGADTPPSPTRRPVRPQLGDDPRIRQALASRNDGLARFWLEPTNTRDRKPVPGLIGRRLAVIDAEDGFATMLAHQVRALGASAAILPYHGQWCDDDYDAIIVGPGPGDPREVTDPKIAALREITTRLIAQRFPFLAVCLGHQVLASVLGLPLRRKRTPAQGTRYEIESGGRRVRVGFYNTFAAYSELDRIPCELTGETVYVDRDRVTGEVHGLRTRGVRSIQFHVESVLTEHGPGILGELLTSILGLRLPMRV